MKLKKKRKILIIFLSLFLFICLSIIVIAVSFSLVNKKNCKQLDEKGFPVYQKPVKKVVTNADYYVSINTGSDSNNGSIDKPFKTIEKVQHTIRELISKNDSNVNKDIVVTLMGGRYNLSSNILFNHQDNLPNNHRLTYTSFNTEEVIISGGVSFKASQFLDLSAEEQSRINEKVRKNVKVINLFNYGISLDKIGKLHAIGGYSQGKKYGEDNEKNAEVFFDDKRMQLAKYPNTGFCQIKEIIDYGEASEYVPDLIDWNNTLTPRPPKFLVDSDIKSKLRQWKKPINPLNSIWVGGYFYWDWADLSSPVKDYNTTLGQLDLAYSSPYGIRSNGTYYIYNVLEELDSFGEYYIDRENGNLYVYFPENFNHNSLITLSLLNESIVRLNETNNLTFDGITIECGRNKAFEINGNKNIIRNVTVKNIGLDGIKIYGQDNLVVNSEVTNTGSSGIIVGRDLHYSEGNITHDIRRLGLRIENNIIENNYIHSYGEVSKSGIAGVTVLGVGNKITHNEIFDSPYTAIHYAGNEHIIEYNYIHHVVKDSSDAGAIYAGRNLSFFGNVIRFNAIFDIGSKNFLPSAIYFDDCLAGQTAYGNILLNIPGNGFLIGGGRAHNIYDNIIINAKNPIYYDARAYDGLNGDWYEKNVIDPLARHWNLLRDAQALYASWLKDPISSNIMKRSLADYTEIMKMRGYDKRFDNDSACNPNGKVYNNIIIAKEKHLGVISSIASKYGQIELNNVYDLDDPTVIKSFINFEKHNFNIKKNSLLANENKNYNSISYHLIGRICK